MTLSTTASWPVPPAADAVLSNGLRIVAVRLPTVPRVELRLTVDLDPVTPADSARAAVLAVTLLRGLPGLDRRDVMTALGRLGCDLVPLSHHGRLTLRGGVLADGLPPLLRLLARALTEATHPDHEVKAARTLLGGQLALARATPAATARALLLRRTRDDEPARQAVPDPRQIADVSADQVRRLHATRITPARGTLVLVGDLDPDATVRAAGRALADWPGACDPAPATTHTPTACDHPHPGATADAPSPSPLGTLSVHPPLRDGAAHLVLSAPVGAAAETPALHLACLLLGGFPGSRLHRRLRDRDALAYTVRASLDGEGDGARITVQADASASAALPLVDAIGDELALLAADPPGARETGAVRDHAIGGARIAWSAQSGLADALTALPAGRRRPAALADRLDALGGTDERTLAAVCRDLLHPSRFTGVLLAGLPAPATARHWRLDTT